VNDNSKWSMPAARGRRGRGWGDGLSYSIAPLILTSLLPQVNHRPLVAPALCGCTDAVCLELHFVSVAPAELRECVRSGFFEPR
jgi:hypothetical protein